MYQALRPERSAPDYEPSYFALGGKTAAVFARGTHVQKIARLVSEGTSVEIVGTRWCGRTELLRRLHQALTAIGVTIITVRGIDQGLPLEALRIALPPAAPGGRQESVSGPGVEARLTRILNEGPAVVLLDDGDFLDNASWTVLEAAHKRTGKPIVSVALQRAAAAPAEHMLIRVAHPVVKIALAELKLETLHDLLEEYLDGPVAPSLSGRVHTKSAGIPGFALAIVDAARGCGQLKKRGDVWRDGPDLWSEELNGAYEALLFSYPNDMREAIQILALAGPISVAQAVELIGQDDVELLEGHGLLRLFTAGQRHLIAVSPPGLGDYFREQPQTVQRLRILAHIEKTLGRLAPGAHVQQNDAREPVAPVRQERLPLVARLFSESYDLDKVLTWNAWSSSHDPAAGVRVLALQLTGVVVADQPWQVVEDTSLDGADPVVELEFRFLHARWLTVNERPFDEIEAAMTAAAGFEFSAALAALVIGLRAERFGIPPDYEEQLSDYAGRSGLNGEVARVVLNFIRILAGNPETALDAFEEPNSSFIGRFADMARGLALFASGRFAEAIEWSSMHVELAVGEGDRPSLTAHSYVAALSLLALARFDDAAEAGQVVISAGVGSALLLFAPDRALMLTLAMAATRTGRARSAEALRERAERYLGRSDALPLGSIRLAEASVVAAGGDLVVAGRQYHETSDALAERGFAIAADGARLLGLLTDVDPVGSAAFRQQAERIGGRLYPAYLDARDASRRRDPDALCAAARILQAEHSIDEALKNFTSAAKLYRELGRTQQAASVRAEIRELVASDDHVTAWAVSKAESTWGLTSREREIIDEVSAGISNIEIAAKHGISVRTIETHMRNIRRKTGAVDREEIATFATQA